MRPSKSLLAFLNSYNQIFFIRQMIQDDNLSVDILISVFECNIIPVIFTIFDQKTIARMNEYKFN